MSGEVGSSGSAAVATEATGRTNGKSGLGFLHWERESHVPKLCHKVTCVQVDIIRRSETGRYNTTRTPTPFQSSCLSYLFEQRSRFEDINSYIYANLKTID